MDQLTLGSKTSTKEGVKEQASTDGQASVGRNVPNGKASEGGLAVAPSAWQTNVGNDRSGSPSLASANGAGTPLLPALEKYVQCLPLGSR
jgi:hypothetical protein